MTEEFDNELDNADVDSIMTAESIAETSVIPPESSAEEALAAAANAIPAAGGPILVDPYAVLSTAAPIAAATAATQTYTAPTVTHAPTATAYHGAHYTSAPNPGPYGYGYPGNQVSHRPVTDGFAIAALACGVAGLLLFAPVIGSILGIVFGIISLNRIRHTGERGHGLAISGIVTGALGLLLGLTALFGLIGLATWWQPYWM